MRRQITYQPDRDYYDLLRVASSASEGEIRRAYRQRVREIHPDLHPNRQAWATQQLQHLNEAYDVLSRPWDRMTYDRLRRRYVRPSPRPQQPSSGPRPRTDTYSTGRTSPGSTEHTRYQSYYSGTRSRARDRAQSHAQSRPQAGGSSTRRYYTRTQRTYTPPTREDLRREQRRRKAGIVASWWFLFLFGLAFALVLRDFTSISFDPPPSPFAVPRDVEEMLATFYPPPTEDLTAQATRDPLAPPEPCLSDPGAVIDWSQPFKTDLSLAYIRGNDIQAWAFRAEPGQQLSLRVDFESALFTGERPALMLCDGAGAKLAQGTHFRYVADTHMLDYVFDEAGTYTIMLAAYGTDPGVFYTFRASLNTPQLTPVPVPIVSPMPPG